MHGKTSGTASQANAGGHARLAEIPHWAAAPVVQDAPRTTQARDAVLIPPPPDVAGNNFADGWPLHTFLALGALPGAVPCARLHVREMLWEWRITELSDSAELIASELVTNAVRISRMDAHAAPVRLWLLSDGVCALIVVWDASPLPPVRMATGDDDESGRGLLLVETLSTRWNWYFPPRPRGGKVVWALVEA
jgi:hypothetical protein